MILVLVKKNNHHKQPQMIFSIQSLRAQGIRFKRFPPVLYIQLKRFMFDIEKMDMSRAPGWEGNYGKL